MRVAVTGATGFVGSDIARALRSGGHSVVSLGRRTPRGAFADDVRAFDLAAPLAADLFAGIEAIVHCAYAVAGRGPDDAYRVNLEGTLALFDLARERSVPFLWTSSLSAMPGALSVYGRQKYALEAALAPRGACIVRPGLVVGNGGLVRSLVDTMRRRHVLPLVDGGGQPVQCLWRGDLSALVRALVEQRCPALTVTAAAEPALTVARLGRDLRAKLGLRALTVNVPFAPAFAAARLIERAGFTSPLASESLLGLRQSRYQPVDDVRGFGVELQPWTGQLAALATELTPEA